MRTRSSVNVTEKPSKADLIHHAEIIHIDNALESWRDAGYDITAAVGEVVDNSIEANAKEIKIRTDYKKQSDGKQRIERISFADNGSGIPLERLAKVLSMGFSTRYNQRSGLGRFGVGLKLAALSLARRVDIFTCPQGSSEVYHTSLDLDLVHKGKQKQLEASPVEGYPDDLVALMQDARGKRFRSGTLVVWSNIDRLSDGGRFGNSLEERLSDVTKFLGRTYRKFLDQGLKIELNGKPISLHDPLFLLDNPRVLKRYPHARGKILDREELDIDGHKVEIAVALVPEEFRWRSGKGGVVDRENRSIAEFYIDENQGKLSILRNGREIYYDIVPRLLPGGVDKVDRYIGIEVSFPATLDDYFQVRHVKRGAEPVAKLREQLRKWLERPVTAARKEVRQLWAQNDLAERAVAKPHDKIHAAVTKAEQTSPKGQAGFDVTPKEASKKIADVLADMKLDPRDPAAEATKNELSQRSVSIIDGEWAGKELVEITHLNGKAIVKLNHRHVFFQQVYGAARKLAGMEASEVDPAEAVRVARKLEVGLDALFMAYAKAENMHEDPEVFDDLRSYWGQFAQAYVREALKEG